MKKLSKIFKLTVFGNFFVISLLNAQISQQWAARYNNGSTDQCNAMTVDAAGNVYLTGSSRSGGMFTEDIATIKYNSSGTMLWTKRYVGSGYGEDHGYAIAVDASGNVYVTGRTWIDAASNNDIITIKYNSAGDSIWVKKYNGSKSNHDEAFAICLDASGNVYITGSSAGTVGPNGIFDDLVVIKYNSSGVQQFAFRYNGSSGGFDKGNSIAVDISGNIYAVGTSWGGSGTPGSGFDMVAIKLNSIGVSQWINRYSSTGNGDDALLDLVIEPLGTLYATGYETNIASDKDYKTLKISSTGALMWSNTYNGPGNSADLACSITTDRSGNIYVTGKSYGGLSTDYDIATVKYNSAGVQVWANSFNGSSSSNDEGKAITTDTSGNVYVTGFSTNTTTAQDYQTIKYNTSGVLQWEIKYTNSGAAGSSDQAISIYANDAGNVYVAGMSALDYAAVKYGAMTGITNINETASGFELKQNYPNPFNPTTNIEFRISETGFVSIKLYDIQGREVQTLVSENLNAGKYTYSFNASGLSSGTYFYKIMTSSFTDVKKMMLIK